MERGRGKYDFRNPRKLILGGVLLLQGTLFDSVGDMRIFDVRVYCLAGSFIHVRVMVM